MVSECTICVSFRGRSRTPPFLYARLVGTYYPLFYFGNSLTHHNRRDWFTSPCGSGLTCSFWICDWQCSMYYYGYMYDLICTPEGNTSFFIFILFSDGGGGGAEPQQTGGEPLPKLKPNVSSQFGSSGHYTPPPSSVEFWLTFGPVTGTCS